MLFHILQQQVPSRPSYNKRTPANAYVTFCWTFETPQSLCRPPVCQIWAMMRLPEREKRIVSILKEKFNNKKNAFLLCCLEIPKGLIRRDIEIKQTSHGVRSYLAIYTLQDANVRVCGMFGQSIISLGCIMAFNFRGNIFTACRFAKGCEHSPLPSDTIFKNGLKHTSVFVTLILSLF